MKTSLQIGLLGAGLSGRILHVPALKRLEGVVIAAVADASSKTLESIRPLVPGAQLYEDPTACVEDPQIDAVIVALPNLLHEKFSRLAFERGRHVYLEKPLTDSLEGAMPVLNAWKASGCVGQIGFNYRWSDLHKAARRQIQEGHIGEPFAVQTVFTSAGQNTAGWRQERRSGGGSLLDRASHHLDLLEWYFDSRLEWIECELKSRRSEHDTAFIQVGLSNGVTAQILTSFDGIEQDRMTFLGSKGGLEVDRYVSDWPRLLPLTLSQIRGKRWMQATRELFSFSLIRRKLARAPHESSYEHALREFVSSIRESRSPAPDLSIGYRSMVILDAAEKAASAGERIRISSGNWTD